MKRRLQFALGAIFFALLLVYGGARLFKSFALLGMESDPGWVGRQVGDQVRVDGYRNTEIAPWLRIGDEIVAINGQPIRQVSDVIRIFHDVDPGRPYTVVGRRNGVPFEVTLSSQAIPLVFWIINGTASLVIPSIFLLTGLIVFLLKPDDKQALLLGLMFGMFTGAIYAFGPSYSGESMSMVAVMLTVHLASLFLWPVFFHFFQIFPEPSPLIRKYPRLEGYLYLPQLVTILPYWGLLNISAAL